MAIFHRAQERERRGQQEEENLAPTEWSRTRQSPPTTAAAEPAKSRGRRGDHCRERRWVRANAIDFETRRCAERVERGTVGSLCWLRLVRNLSQQPSHRLAQVATPGRHGPGK